MKLLWDIFSIAMTTIFYDIFWWNPSKTLKKQILIYYVYTANNCNSTKFMSISSTSLICIDIRIFALKAPMRMIIWSELYRERLIIKIVWTSPENTCLSNPIGCYRITLLDLSTSPHHITSKIIIFYHFDNQRFGIRSYTIFVLSPSFLHTWGEYL